ncbi:MAG: zinc ribbon domain-containing protein [Candidatus Heimdallarchaeota archaeon]|nr:MAG: zinc ribbon domain-containing protein [Candidatus Heimdallarchaeota archaeon]
MKCLKCGTANPDQAKFCFECGTTLPEPLKTDLAKTTTYKYCPKCSTSNPITGLFCFECGNPLEDISRPQPRLCPTCGISIDSSRLFCPNCSQSLIEKPLDVKEEQISTIETRTECPACGQLTTGDYCRSCGFNLLKRQQKRPLDWWYCDRDSAIMAEIDPNSQILVSRSSLDESLAQAIDNNILQHQDREKARSLALQLFESTNTKFEVLSQVRCPVCSQKSLAPTTKRPRQVGIRYTQEITLNVSSMLHNGMFYLRTYPKLLLIALCAIVVDVGVLLLGFGVISALSTDSLLSFLGVPITGTSIPIGGFTSTLNTLFVGTIASFTVNILVQCWYYTSLKEITNNKPLEIGKSFKNSLRYFPRALGAQILILAAGIGFIIGLVLVFIIFAGIFFYDIGYQFVLLLLLFLLIGILGVGVLAMLLNVLLSYVNMSIVFDEGGIILGLKRSWRFARKFFWTTVGIIIIFSIGSYIVGYVQAFSYMFAYLAILPSLITALIYTILTRLIEAYKSLSMGWGYQAFNYMID